MKNVWILSFECAGIVKVGGLGEAVYNISRQLTKRGFNVTLFMPSHEIHQNPEVKERLGLQKSDLTIKGGLNENSFLPYRIPFQYNIGILDAFLEDSREAQYSEEDSKAQFLAETALDVLRGGDTILTRLLQTLELEQSSGDLEISLKIQSGLLDVRVRSSAFPPELTVGKMVYTPLLPYYNLRIDVLNALGVSSITASRPAIIYLLVEGGCVGGFELHHLSPKGWNLFFAHNDHEAGRECQNYYEANYRLNPGQALSELEIEITYVPFYLAPTYAIAGSIFFGLLAVLAFLIIRSRERRILTPSTIISRQDDSVEENRV